MTTAKGRVLLPQIFFKNPLRNQTGHCGPKGYVQKKVT